MKPRSRMEPNNQMKPQSRMKPRRFSASGASAIRPLVPHTVRRWTRSRTASPSACRAAAAPRRSRCRRPQATMMCYTVYYNTLYYGIVYYTMLYYVVSNGKFVPRRGRADVPRLRRRRVRRDRAAGSRGRRRVQRQLPAAPGRWEQTTTVSIFLELNQFQMS